MPKNCFLEQEWAWKLPCHVFLSVDLVQVSFRFQIGNEVAKTFPFRNDGIFEFIFS